MALTLFELEQSVRHKIRDAHKLSHDVYFSVALPKIAINISEDRNTINHGYAVFDLSHQVSYITRAFYETHVEYGILDTDEETPELPTDRKRRGVFLAYLRSKDQDTMLHYVTVPIRIISHDQRRMTRLMLVKAAVLSKNTRLSNTIVIRSDLAEQMSLKVQQAGLTLAGHSVQVSPYGETATHPFKATGDEWEPAS